MLFPIVNSYKDILDALEEYQGAFIQHTYLSAVGKDTYEDSTKVFDEMVSSSLEEKTMFPTKIASLPGVERQVIQQYIARLSERATTDTLLFADILDIVDLTFPLVDALLVTSKDRYGWSEQTFKDVMNMSEWTVNIARYPFQKDKEGEILFPAHKDWGMLAIYPYVHGAGLEVYNPHKAGGYGGWQWLEIPEGCTFCYAGDIFDRITNYKVKPLLHRVSQPTNQVGSRTSIIFYVDPPREMVLPSGDKVGDIIDSKLKKIGQIK